MSFHVTASMTSYLDTLRTVAVGMLQRTTLHAPASELLNKLDQFTPSGIDPNSHQVISLPCFTFSLSNTRELIGRVGEADLVIGGTIRVDSSNIISYQSICVTLLFRDQYTSQPHSSGSGNGIELDGTVLRRFHFDYDAEIADDCSKHWPVAHLQYGGKHNERYLPDSWNGAAYSLFEKIDRPRLLTPPLDLILVTDLFVRQFKPVDGMEMLEDGTWLKATLSRFVKPASR